MWLVTGRLWKYEVSVRVSSPS